MIFLTFVRNLRVFGVKFWRDNDTSHVDYILIKMKGIATLGRATLILVRNLSENYQVIILITR